MTPEALPEPASRIANLVTTLMAEVRPELVRAALSGDRGEQRNERHTDNFLSVHDTRLHERYRELLKKELGSFVYASEEAEPQVVGDQAEPDLCVLVDPLDTSELAVRGLNGYTHVMVYSRSLARPVVSVVGDIFHYFQMYVGVRGDEGADRAFVVTRDSEHYPLTATPTRVLSESLVTNFLMRPAERFAPLARQRRFLDALSEPAADGKSRGRIGVDFGSVGLCHVAAGFSDAVVEFAKGFALWDLAPGHHILHGAGGVVLDLEGSPVPLSFDFGSLGDIARAMGRRQKFVAAGSTALAHEILATLSLAG